MERVIFSNKMGIMNIVYIGLAIGLGAVVVLLQEGGRNFGMMAAIMGCIFLFCLLVMWLVIKLVASRNIAHLAQSATGMTAEMTHMLGRGRVIALPATGPEDWGWEVQRVGKRGNQRVPVLKLNVGGATYKLWLSGAKVFDKDAFRQLAPVPMQEMEAAGFFK